jgi:hypothetical protein
VTIAAYVDGKPATSDSLSANGASFAMDAWWSAKNIGIGKGSYPLSAAGFNSGNQPYVAITTDMSTGANYSTRAQISWDKTNIDSTSGVSGNCRTGDPYTLVGYTTGDSMASAAAGTPTTSYAAFHTMTQNEYVIVWYRHCLTQPQPTFPKNGLTESSAALTHLDWNPVTSPFGTVSYIYQASNDWHTNTDGSFASVVYESSPQATSTIVAGGTPPGTYYWHVKAIDSAGNSSFWGPFYKVNVK